MHSHQMIAILSEDSSPGEDGRSADCFRETMWGEIKDERRTKQMQEVSALNKSFSKHQQLKLSEKHV